VNVRTLFFATYRDLVGAPEVTIELDDGATVAELLARLRGRGEGFASLPEHPAVAVNLEYARHDRALRDGDEVAFIPPVAGG